MGSPRMKSWCCRPVGRAVQQNCALTPAGPDGSSRLPRHGAGPLHTERFHGFKGLDAAAVIVTDIAEIHDAKSEALFYIASSRARDDLTIIARDTAHPDLGRTGTGRIAMLEKDRTAGRGKVIEALRAELLGPAAVGKPLDSFKFEKKEESYGPWINAATGEEILERDPLIRYGVRVLFSVGDATSPNIANQAIVPGLTAEKTEGPDTGAWEGSAGRLRSGL